MGKLGTFGERLTELMAETELTAKGLAERLGVSSSTVYRWKNDACSTTFQSDRSLRFL